MSPHPRLCLIVLLALSFTIALYPALVARGEIQPLQAAVWGATPAGIVGTIATEAVFALVLGFTARMIFEAINFGAYKYIPKPVDPDVICENVQRAVGRIKHAAAGLTARLVTA